MGKYIKLIVGLFLIFCSVVGGFNALTGGFQESGMRIVNNGTDAVGYVEKRVRHIVGAKVGRLPAGGVYYMMHYNFRTKEGELYGDSVKVTKEQAYSLRDGQKINIRYMKGQPSINSVMGIEAYMTEEDAKDVPWGTISVAFAMFLLGGIWLVRSGWRAIGWSLPAFGKREKYELDRGALLNRDVNRTGGQMRGGGQPMFGGKR